MILISASGLPLASFGLLSLIILIAAFTYLRRKKSTFEFENPRKMNQQSIKQQFKNVIVESINEHKYNLSQVKDALKEKFQKPLSNCDEAFCERKYMKVCSNAWLKETADFLDSKGHHFFQYIFSALSKVNSLTNIPDELKQLDYYKLLMQHSKLLSKDMEKDLISRFKKGFLNQLLSQNSSVKLESVFIERLVDFLKSKNRQRIIFDLKLTEFCSLKLRFSDLLERVLSLDTDTYGNTLLELQKAARNLPGKDLLLIDTLTQMIEEYIMEPKVMPVREIDGRLVLEVIGPNVVIGEILSSIEEKFTEYPNIEEVRLIGSFVVHIDKDIEKEIWHGKNIVIQTQSLIIHGKVTWDVSGKNAQHAYKVNAGTGGDGHGKQGGDGYPGESGGNVLVLTDDCEDIENFTIISNGGDGSKGQDGGNGRNGKNGTGKSSRDLKTWMPPPASLFSFASSERVIEILKTIKDEAVCQKTVWSQGSGESNLNNLIYYIENVAATMDNIYVEATLRDGTKVTFSYYCGIMCVAGQAFLLIKGSEGSRGGDGGACGLGGQGGYAGHVVFMKENNPLHNLKLFTFDGSGGANGKSGSCGTHGRNGWDTGYMDYWRDPPTSYGTDENSRIQINYYNSTGRYCIWCPYMGLYAYMSRATIDHTSEKKYGERINARATNERQLNARAVRKKTISTQSVVSTYAHCFNSVEKETFRTLQSNVEATQQNVLQTSRDMDREQTKQTIGLVVQRHVPFNDSTKRRAPKITPVMDEEAIHSDVEEPQSGLLDNGGLNLKTVELSISQLEELFLVTSRQQAPLDVEELLIKKYRFAKLRQFAKDWNPPRVDVPQENNEKYLVAGVNRHPIFTNQNEFVINNHDILLISLKMFILETGGIEGGHPTINRIHDEFTEFDEAQKCRLKDIVTELNDELSRLENRELYDLFIESLKNEIEENIFVSKIAEIEKLKTIYSNFKTELKTEFIWNRKDVLSLKAELTNHIKEKGLLSRCCRESLALAYKTNVRIYADDPFNGLHLIDNHNPQSEVKLHILYGSNQFTQFEQNENYLMLDSVRDIENTAYGVVLASTDLFYNKKDLDNYFRNFNAINLTEISECKEFFDENEAIKEIGKFFPKKQLKKRLEMLSKYAGGTEILRYIFLRLSSEGMHISYLEMSHLINSIVDSFIENNKIQNIYCWIIAAHSQRNWIDELTLLHLENYFKNLIGNKSLWREYFSKIRNKNIVMLMKSKLSRASSLTLQCVEETLFLLSSIPHETVSLEDLELSEWPYVLKETFWLCKLKALTVWQDKEKLSVACYYLLSMDNTFGHDLVIKLLDALKMKQTVSPAYLTEILSNFYQEKWNLSNEVMTMLQKSNLREWNKKMKQTFSQEGKVRNLNALLKLIRNNENTSSEIAYELPNVAALIKKFCHDGHVIKAVANSPQDISNWAKKVKTSNGAHKTEVVDLVKKLAVVVRGIEIIRGFRLRDTQLLTVAALLTNSRSTLAQVSTGEGKSLIVVAASIIKALSGDKVDVITSSSVLAKRDAEEYRDIYNMFGINVSHNCNEDIEKRKEAYSNNDVVYGDLSNFQRDYLLDRFYGKNVLGDRNFSNIIVDEVDSMLLDKGNNMLYLSHNIAGLDKLESLFIFIWQWIKLPFADIGQAQYAFDAAAIKDAVLRDMYGLLKPDDLEKLDAKINQTNKTTIWERLVEKQFIRPNGTLESDSIDFNELSRVVSSRELCQYEDRLKFLFKGIVGRKKRIKAPKSLRCFIESHLDSWIENAKRAYHMKEGQDYVVDVDRSGSSSDRDPNITIIDRDTGTDQANSQWDEGLHQFLQLKHGCRISLQSLKAVFISNVSFLKLYKNLYGLTGTLGSKIERDLLRNVYKVDFVTIPTASAKLFREDQPILCNNKQSWIQEIYKRALTLTLKNKRSVLIICDTVNDVHILSKEFSRNNVPFRKYVRDYEELEIAKGDNGLQCKEIIIATNLAGRGTDIKMSEALKQAGGLHVLLTYLPNNIRIEQQAFGRAARCGENGSGQLIFIDHSGHQYSFGRLIELKKERNVGEIHRLSEIKTYYETQILMEETCFKGFKEQYERLKTKLSNDQVPQQVSEILLQSCLDKWAFWLDENTDLMKNAGDDQSTKRVESLLNEFLPQFRDLTTGFGKSCTFGVVPVTEYNSSAWCPWVDGNPTQMTKLATLLCKQDDYKNSRANAIILLDKVIKCEPGHSEAAHYYKAFALAKGIDFERKPFTDADRKLFTEFEKELRAAAKMFKERADFHIIASGVIATIKENSADSIIQVDSYEKQKKNLASYYDMFSQSLDDISGRALSPQSFMNHETSQVSAEILFNDLLKKGIIEKPRINKPVTNEALTTIINGYDIPIKKLANFLSIHDKIDEHSFKKGLKKTFNLPGREAFWKMLISHKVLTDEIKYVLVNTVRMQEVEPCEFEWFCHQRDNNLFADQSLTFDYGHAILYYEWLTPEGQLKLENIYRENDLIIGLGKHKYEILKKRHCLLVNKVAKFSPENRSSIVLPQSHSITLNGITETLGIVRSDAEQILKLLVKKHIVVQRNKTSFVLNINDEYNHRIALPPFSVYENAIQGLLSSSFKYKEALQKMVKQYNEKEAPIRVHLVSKPYNRLYMDLLDHEALIPPMASFDDANLENELKKIYTMTKDEWLDTLSKYVHSNEEGIDLLFQTLVNKKWISLQSEPVLTKLTLLLNSKKPFHDKPLYLINKFRPTAKPRPPLNLITKIGSDSYPIHKAMEFILDRILYLQSDESINNVMDTLEIHTGSLKTLKAPDSKLKYLDESQFNFGNALELHLLHLNGLDQLLQFGEKRWSRYMFYNTTIGISLGVAQIAIGATVDHCLGMSSNVGATLMFEGLRDLFYAAGDIYSGYYSPENHWRHKRQRLMMAAMATILSHASDGMMLWLGYSFTDKGVYREGRSNLIVNAGVKTAGMEVARRIAVKTAQGLALGVASAGIDDLVDNHMRGLCENIGSNILSNIERDVNNHHISGSLKKAWRVLGEKGARQMVKGLKVGALEKEGDYLAIVNQMETLLSQGVKLARNVLCDKTVEDLTFILNIISTVAKGAEFAITIHNISEISVIVLNDLDRQIIDTLKNRKLDIPCNLEEGGEEEFEKFRKNELDQWERMLRIKVGRIISRLVKPVFQRTSTDLIRLVFKEIRASNLYHIGTGNLAACQELKLEDKEYRQNLVEGREMVEAQDYATAKYHEDLRKLLLKTKNPELFTQMVREGIPMDLTCVSACTQVVDKLLKNIGIVNVSLSILVKGEGGTRYEFRTEGKGDIPVTIALDLIDDLFKFSKDGASNKKNTVNNCLYVALVSAFPQIREANLTAKRFRSEVAKMVETDRNLRYLIQEGWYRLSTSLRAYGDRSVFTVPTAQAGSEYQHTHSDYPGWSFNKERIRVQRADAFNKALYKINEKLLNIGKVSKPVTSADFTSVMKYDILLCDDPLGQIKVVLFPIEIEATVEVEVPDVPGCVPDVSECAPDVSGCVPDLSGCVQDVPGCVSDVPGCVPDVPGCSPDVPGCVQDVPGCVPDVPGCSPDVPGCVQDVPGCVPDVPRCVPYRLRIVVDGSHKQLWRWPVDFYVRYKIIPPNDEMPEGVTGHISFSAIDGLFDAGCILHTEPSAVHTVPIFELFSTQPRLDTYFGRELSLRRPPIQEQFYSEI